MDTTITSGGLVSYTIKINGKAIADDSDVQSIIVEHLNHQQ